MTPRHKQIVNVASVPKRSPFRYPGGKTWLVPVVRRWLMWNGPKKRLVEPFAGGAIVGLTAAFEGLSSTVLLNEIDPDVAAVWDVIIEQGQGPWLAKQILNFKFSAQSIRVSLSREPLSVKQRAFQTILKNRVNRGGILAPGAGVMKDGENGKGLASRWYPETLAKRIRDISALTDRLRFESIDGIKLIRSLKRDTSALFFVDPPYTVAGSRLYRFSELDHDALFAALADIKGDFLATYDDSPEIRKLAQRFGFETDTVPMKNTHHAKMEELIISKSLAWLHDEGASQGASEQFSLQIASA